MDIVTSFDNLGGKGDRRSILTSNVVAVIDGTETTYMSYGNGDQINIDIVFSGLEGKLYIDCIKVIRTNYGFSDKQILLNDVVIGTFNDNVDSPLPLIKLKKNDKLTIRGRNKETGGGTYPTYIREIQFKTFFIPYQSFIYHEGYYKKYVRKKTGENIIPDMTSDTTPSGIAFGDSTFSASYPYWYAFTSLDSQCWVSSSTLPLPHFIGYDFGQPRKIRSYGVKNRTLDANDLITAPNTWILQGSNNNSTWIDLDSVSGITWASKGLEKKFDLKESVEYRYYRLYITANNGYSGGAVSIAKLSLFEEDTVANWEYISTTLPEKNLFLEKGMYLTPVFDRIVETLDTVEMTDISANLAVGEVGKLFSKTIDLMKCFDIRNIKVEVK